MFQIFKKNKHYDLSWLRVDMHSHILPGIDDGSPDTESSIRYIRGLQELGFDRLFMTPHIFHGVHPNDTHSIRAAYDRLIQAVPDDICRDIGIETAAEHMVTLEFDGKAEIADNCLLPGKRILIEMSYLAASPNIDTAIFDLQMKGYQPILAHPERYPYYFHQDGHFEQLRTQGCLLQCNLLSFAGYYGKSVKKAAEALASQGLIDYLGTDLHHDRHLHVLQDYYRKHDGKSIFAKCSIFNSELK
ncbi:MAG TPA: hypothetical protein PLO39_09460 [Saprospiraceae bacterium]|jgi:protein-tyrosine phosphatase|nr:hypothetical protein [Saprospiraceae bacterium]